MDLLIPSFGLIFWTLLAFLIVFYILKKFAWKPILKSLKDRENNISEVSFHRWKRRFGHMEINEARRLKELERENRELKQMLADSLLKNRVLEAVCEKKL